MNGNRENDVPRGIVMYGTSWCGDCHRARHIFDSFGVAYEDIDVDHDEAGLAIVRHINGGKRVVPTIIFPDGSVLVEPSNSALMAQIGVGEGDG